MHLGIHVEPRLQGTQVEAVGFGEDHVRCDACMDADPAQAPEIRSRQGAAIAARKWALPEWDKANPGAVHDPQLFRRDILSRLATIKLSEIAEAVACSKASASDIRRGKWTPYVSTLEVLARLVGVEIIATTPPDGIDPADTSADRRLLGVAWQAVRCEGVERPRAHDPR